MNTAKPNTNPLLNDDIWLAVDSQILGGIETHILELASGLIQFKQKVRVVLLTEYSDSQPILSKLELAKIPYNFLSELSNCKGNANVLTQLRCALKLHRPALIHTHGYKASVVSRLACLHCKWIAPPKSTVQVSTYHAGEAPVGKVKLYDMIDRFTASLSDLNFAVSKDIANKIPSKTHVLNNFVALQSCPTRFGENIAFVGRLSHEKAPDRYIELAKNFPQHDFHLYGSGPMTSQLDKMAGGNIWLHGHIDDMNSVWSDIDVLIITSRFEGLPMAALEAMSRGIPVISTNVGALDSLIISNENGWIGNDMTELSHALNIWLLASEPTKSAIRTKARQTIERRFSLQAVIPQYLEQYQTVLEQS
ncbi:glycosyltransferase family 4 protein [Vibrio sp. VB16]|uniref:glycosyltransferase family 4 protein n=1 Tax=Vibrio sp. VB16 TaxID=2785746 RepID=UPI00189D8205|nr:glycosyltransferase family 4 protein [Vibrio sp. VB16]UGA57721.1 glycosyltransferase family 4 protein [Vibrio sp. VB16]